ncbi:hypothetical protein I8748_05625 [Nostoc sp. CENA67]|uniref:Uncharacterized protein n=1 Tax=Amazonocrinis nigriterrae CENA67 TaxID=2794033 RepID=A0A8J7HQ55_9NOST|nr:hypothetical protein [Amazonocrinis nigriterrae]MBH8561663.1 hypothetical protein [Amazonocrinis nigriterrae CENA67]
MADEQKIVVEVPSDRGYSPIPNPQSPNKLEQFKKGWINAIVFPDNPADLVFDVTTSITIPALISSCWASFPILQFLKVGALIAIGIAALGVWHLLAIPELKDCLMFRLILVTVGVVIGL